MAVPDQPLQFTSAVEDQVETQTGYNSYTERIVSPADASTQDQMNIVEASGTLSFWDDPAEDQYSGQDGDAT